MLMLHKGLLQGLSWLRVQGRGGEVEMTGAVKELKSKQELEEAVKKSVAVLHFWATWCEPSKAMEPVFAQLAVDAPQAKFFRVCTLISFPSLPFWFVFFALFSFFIWEHIRRRSLLLVFCESVLQRR